ncbi:glycosyltransferase [Lactococcus petauri]|uniref:Glycosyltransferase n=1 Tax=Lactococcus formosensis TaxID=1281486 RepID=A0A9X4SPG4_9LACT|nr:glycosyltransferase [Lactococcus formosensis]MDG6194552.1 glycosyltransferase [Lactococcus formosensis]
MAANIYDAKYTIFHGKNRRKIHSYNPDVTIIIPAFNEEKCIERTLKSVYHSKYSNKKVIVVDDGSSDNTSYIVKQFINKHNDFNLELIVQKNGGKSTAINNALFKKVDSELTMVLDADSELTSDAIEKAVKWFINSNIIALAINVKMLYIPNLVGLSQKYEFISAYRGKCAEHVLKTMYIVGGIGSTFRTKALKEVNGYDTDTPTEDIDLTLKLISHYGNKKNIIGYANDSIVYTQPVQKFSSLLKQRYRWKYGRFVAFVKYKSLFFNIDNKFSKTLTFYQLPMAIIQEIFMIIEPYIYLYLLWVVINYKSIPLLFSMLLYCTIIVGLSMIKSGTSLKQQLLILIVAPLNFFLSYILTLVEYFSLINSIIHSRSIFDYKKNHASWNHVERM